MDGEVGGFHREGETFMVVNTKELREMRVR